MIINHLYAVTTKIPILGQLELSAELLKEKQEWTKSFVYKIKPGSFTETGFFKTNYSIKNSK